MVRYRSFLLISCSTLDHVNEQRSPLREILPLIDRSTGVKVRSIRDEKISVYKIIHVRKLYPLWIGKLQVDALIFSFKVQLHLSLTSVNRKYMYHLVYIILELGRGDFPLDFSGWTRPKCTVWTDWPIGALERTGKWICEEGTSQTSWTFYALPSKWKGQIRWTDFTCLKMSKRGLSNNHAIKLRLHWPTS